MIDKILKKGAKLSSDKIKMTPEIQKSIDNVIEKQKELLKSDCYWANGCNKPSICRSECVHNFL